MPHPLQTPTWLSIDTFLSAISLEMTSYVSFTRHKSITQTEGLCLTSTIRYPKSFGGRVDIGHCAVLIRRMETSRLAPCSRISSTQRRPTPPHSIGMYR